MYRPYQRSFITLKQERSDYTLSGRNALGTVILEIRGSSVKLHASLQHLIPDRLYYLRLVAIGQNTALCVTVARFDMQPNGKGDARCQLNADDIADTGLPIEDFHLFLITSGNSQELNISLLGFYDQIKDKAQITGWKDKLVFFESQQAQKTDRARANQGSIHMQPEADASVSKALSEAEQIIEEEAAISPGIEIERAADPETEIAQRIQWNEEAEWQTKMIRSDAFETNILQDNAPSNTLYTEREIIDPDGFILINEPEIAIKDAEEDMIVGRNCDYDQYPESSVQYMETCLNILKNEPEQAYSYNETNDQTNIGIEEEIRERPEEKQENQASSNDQDTSETSHSSDFHAAFKAMAQKFHQELNELNAYTALTEDEMKAHQLSWQDISPNPDPAPAYATGNQNEINRILSQNEAVSPFHHQKKDVDWVRIGLDELTVLPFDFMKYLNSPLVLSGFYQYKHLLLGRIKNIESPGAPGLILGIPDHYDYAYKALASELEFRQFKPCDGEELHNGVFGYWLLFM